MKSLITGCQGFIGKNLAQHLKKQGHHVTGLDKKLKVGDPVFVDEFIGHNMETAISIENDFDRVYHLSADVPNSKGVGSAQLTTQTDWMTTCESSLSSAKRAGSERPRPQ